VKVALVYPKHIPSEGEKKISKLIGGLSNRWKGDKFYLQTPLSLLIAARFIDGEVELFLEGKKEFIPDKKYGLVIFSFMTCQCNRAIELANECRKLDIPTACGGIHPTFDFENMKRYFDFVFIGEMEETFPRFLEEFKNGRKDGIYYGNRENVNWSVIPRYDLIDFETQSIIPIQLTRGCPYRCEFCSSSRVFGVKFRKKSYEIIKNELELINRLADGRKIHLLFVDDNLFLDREYSIEVLKLFSNYDFTFSTYSDIKIGSDEELLSFASKAGLKYIFSGLETTNSTSIKDVSGMKMRILSKYPQYIEKIQSAGIGVFGSFIIGFDNDTIETIDGIKDFLSETTLYRASFGFLTPYPGTPLFDRMKSEKRIIGKDWNEFTEWNLTIKHPTIDGEVLRGKLVELYNFFYSKEMGLKRINYFKKLWRKP
jgi:radical SAM superfamily enzyme YgiQ (UPF0313 family)